MNDEKRQTEIANEKNQADYAEWYQLVIERRADIDKVINERLHKPPGSKINEHEVAAIQMFAVHLRSAAAMYGY